MFHESNMAFQTQTLSSEQLQALFESITAQQSQGDKVGETPLDTQHSWKQKVKQARTKWCQGYHHHLAERTEAENS